MALNVHFQLFSNHSAYTYVVSTHKNRLYETVLLITHNKGLGG